MNPRFVLINGLLINLAQIVTIDLREPNRAIVQFTAGIGHTFADADAIEIVHAFGDVLDPTGLGPFRSEPATTRVDAALETYLGAQTPQTEA